MESDVVDNPCLGKDIGIDRHPTNKLNKKAIRTFYDTRLKWAAHEKDAMSYEKGDFLTSF